MEEQMGQREGRKELGWWEEGFGLWGERGDGPGRKRENGLGVREKAQLEGERVFSFKFIFLFV
jgi:hypothetical protein